MNPTTEKLPASTKPGNFRDWLQSEFSLRRSRNSAYSLRSFARLLSLDASSVSQLLNGKRNASPKLLTKLCDRLNADPDQRQILLQKGNVQSEGDVQYDKNFQQITIDSFAVISDWYHYAILELTYCKGFRNDHAWIARRLGITAVEVASAVDRLKRLNLLVEKNGRLLDANAHLTNIGPGLSVPAMRSLQKQVLTMALDALDNITPDDRDMSSMTMAIDPKYLPEAREKIKKFRRSLSKYFEGGTRSRVYHLGIQLYPVTKAEN